MATWSPSSRGRVTRTNRGSSPGRPTDDPDRGRPASTRLTPSSTSPAPRSPARAGRGSERRSASQPAARDTQPRGGHRAATEAAAVLLSGSAVGYYGHRGEEPVTEDTPKGSDFLADLAAAWEDAAAPVARAGVRLVWLRTGLALAPDGGVLGAHAAALRLGLGGRLGSGRQYVPWIHKRDWIDLGAMGAGDAGPRGRGQLCVPGARPECHVWRQRSPDYFTGRLWRTCLRSHSARDLASWRRLC